MLELCPSIGGRNKTHDHHHLLLWRRMYDNADKWDDRLENSQFRALQRARLAATAETDATRQTAMRARRAPRQPVTVLAPLVEECLEEMRACTKRAGRAPLAPQMELLPKGIRASAAMEPYLWRWKLLDV